MKAIRRGDDRYERLENWNHALVDSFSPVVRRGCFPGLDPRPSARHAHARRSVCGEVFAMGYDRAVAVGGGTLPDVLAKVGLAGDRVKPSATETM
jgi:hypothetical protein